MGDHGFSAPAGLAAQAGSSLRLSDTNRVPPKNWPQGPSTLHSKPYDLQNSQHHFPSNLCTILHTAGKIARRRPDEPSVHAGRVVDPRPTSAMSLGSGENGPPLAGPLGKDRTDPSGLLRVAGHIWKTSPPTIRVGLLPGHDASASLRPDASHYRN